MISAAEGGVCARNTAVIDGSSALGETTIESRGDVKFGSGEAGDKCRQRAHAKAWPRPERTKSTAGFLQRSSMWRENVAALALSPRNMSDAVPFLIQTSLFWRETS